MLTKDASGCAAANVVEKATIIRASIGSGIFTRFRTPVGTIAKKFAQNNAIKPAMMPKGICSDPNGANTIAPYTMASGTA